jgi:anti-sigma B factor antagonist
MDTTWQAAQPQIRAAFAIRKESTLKLSLETRYQGDIIIVHCQGRIVYRDEAAALSRVVGEVMPHARKLVLDLSGVSSIDSAGIGELALLYTWSQRENTDFKVAGPNSLVRNLLDLTNLNSVLEIHSSVENALEAFHEDGVCADC